MFELASSTMARARSNCSIELRMGTVADRWFLEEASPSQIERSQAFGTIKELHDLLPFLTAPNHLGSRRPRRAHRFVRRHPVKPTYLSSPGA
jgi:hypothetical protein